MPREIRHDLGEYYTPNSWLSSVERLGYEGQTDRRLLDPACRSGTFLILAIKRLRNRCFREGLNEQETLETILKNIVGIDLNPLAAIAARTNYLLALGDLLTHRTSEIDIPVYLANSILVPATGARTLDQDRYEIATVVGQLDIPVALRPASKSTIYAISLRSASQTKSTWLCSLTGPTRSWYLRHGLGGRSRLRGRFQSGFAGFVRTPGQPARPGIDGIWARILQNAFMPLFLSAFITLLAILPWVNWQNLPEEYRTSTAPLWQKSGIFETRGLRTVLGPAQEGYLYAYELCCY